MSLNRQAVFDTAYLGLRGQGFLRSVGGPECRYRGTNGRKCAVGHLFGDDMYSSKMEGRGVCSGEIRKAIEEAGFGDFPVLSHEVEREIRSRGGYPDKVFMQELQSAHDSSTEYLKSESEVMERALRNFAATWDLTVPE